MRIGEVIGMVTLSRGHASLAPGAYRLTIPLTLTELASGSPPQGESIVVFDEFGAGVGSRIAISEGGEAAQPFLPAVRPIDAYNAAILDTVQLETFRHDNQ